MAFETLNQQPFGALRTAPFSPLDEPDRGVVSTIVHELGLDLLGGARVGVATGGELLSMLGFAVPITYEDLSTRDVKGAAMLAALGVSGLAGGATRGALSLANTWGGRAAATAITETVAGAAFGLVQPLEDDQSRLGAIAGGAALGGAVGAGASMIKSAAKATVGARIGAIRMQAARVKIGEAVAQQQTELMLREAAGIRLNNPISNMEIGIRRSSQDINKISVTYYEPGKKAVTTTETDFGGAVARAVKEGFTQDMRPWDPQRALAGMEGLIDNETMKLLDVKQGNIYEAIGLAEVGRYRAVREAADLDDAFRKEMTALVGEALAPANELGTPTLDAATRATTLEELSIKGVKQIPFMDGSQDGELLRLAARAGLVDVRNLAEGAAFNDFVSELTINNAFAPGVAAHDIIVNRQKDLVFASILLPNRIAKWFPAMSPVVQTADAALAGIQVAMEKHGQWLYDLKQSVSLESAEAAVAIIDDSIAQTMDPILGKLVDDPIASQALAIAKAQATGNAEIVHFVEQATERLAAYKDGFQQLGLLGEGLSGYFPIVNANKWHLAINDFGPEGEVKFQGFWDTAEQALAEVDRLRASNPNVQGLVSPRGFRWERGAMMGLEPAQWGRMRKSMVEAFTKPFGPEAKGMADQAMNKGFYIKPAAPKKGAPQLKQRVLGIRDFAANPFDALDTYAQNAERTLALHSFEATVKPLIDILPDSQSNLKEWGYKYIDDIMGRPTRFERAFDATMEHMGLDVQSRGARRYTSMMRKWESFSRLGGVFSGVVNLSQIAINTYPELGARYTARGFAALSDRGAAHQILIDNGVDLGIAMPFTEAGEATRAFFGGPVAALKEKRFVEAANRFALYAFNEAEQLNRLVSAWGGFQRAKDAGMSNKMAAAAAQEVVNRTQFNYRLSNMPEILRGPVGGLMLQFKSFVINEIDFIASMTAPQMARFGAAVSALGGASLFLNMPGPDIANLSSLLWSDQKISQGLQRAEQEGDSTLGRLAVYGLPGLLGVNMSDNLGVGAVKEVANGFLGPSAKDAAAFYTFLKNARIDHVGAGRISNETQKAFLQSVMPSAIRRAQRGIAIANTGEVRSSYTGKLIYKPAERGRVAWATAVGLPTVDMTYEITANEVVERARASYVQARGSFGREMGLAIIQGRTADYRQTLNDSRAAGHIFTADDVQRWVKEMRRPSSDRRRQRTAKVNRQELDDLFELTGSTDPIGSLGLLGGG